MTFTGFVTLVSMFSTFLATIGPTDVTESITSIFKSSTQLVASHILLNLLLFAFFTVMMHPRFILSVTTLLSQLPCRVLVTSIATFLRPALGFAAKLTAPSSSSIHHSAHP